MAELNKWKWTSCETRLRMAEEKIAELEAVCVVAEDTLRFNFQLFDAIIDQGESNGWIIAHPDWLKEARSRSEAAMAATQHRRI